MLRSVLRPSALIVVALAAACASRDEPPPNEAPAPPAAEAAAVHEEPAAAAATPSASPRELPFEPSEGDKAAFEVSGYLGVRTLPPDAGFAKGPIVAGVKPGGGAEKAGIQAKDVIVEFAGVSFPADDDNPLGALRARLLELPFDSDAQVKVWREGEGVREMTVRLGRRPPPFADRDTPSDWFARVSHDDAVEKLIADAVALDHGESRYAGVVDRNRKHLAKTDSFRLRQITQAHLDLAANERLARTISASVAEHGEDALALFAEAAENPPSDPRPAETAPTLERVAEDAAAIVAALDSGVRAATGSWTADDRAFVAANFAKLTERLNEGEYLFDDPQFARERANRRLVELLSRVDRLQLMTTVSSQRERFDDLADVIAAVAERDGREGLLISKDTPAGRIEIWGGGNTRHTARTAFCFDLGGNDDWLDCAGAADLDHPVSISIDWQGNDTYGATSPFQLGGALGGIGILWDCEGDDQYLARSWSQGCGVAGFGLLCDDAGRDVYHGQDECQGIGLSGAGVIEDTGGADLYTGARFCQGVGLPGGVGAVIDKSGDDRYVCTGRYESEYGEPGLFSGFGQGVGFGFRHIASGGIGVLYDLAGNDVYEAGNFSQGGAYFYAWGILRDDAGNDRYIGSRYAQGFAAHQAVGTFLEGGGDDLYQSHSTVACGLAWDECSVVFHDVAGDDVYEQGGFSLASAAHNSLVLFLDDAGNDRYAALPAHAASNEYHGGRSFALFVDGAGDDVYGSEKPAETSGGSQFRDEGAYFIDR